MPECQEIKNGRLGLYAKFEGLGFKGLTSFMARQNGHTAVECCDVSQRVGRRALYVSNKRVNVMMR